MTFDNERARMDEHVAENDLDMMSEIIGENLLDLSAQARVLVQLYDDRRPELVRRRMARNSMVLRAHALGHLDFDEMWRQHLHDVESLAAKLEDLLGPTPRPRNARSGGTRRRPA